MTKIKKEKDPTVTDTSPDQKENQQELSDALAEISPDLAKIIERVKVKADVRTEALEAAKETREEIAPDGKLAPEQMWAPCAPMPTEMCRVSPFFPMARQKLGERPFIRDMIITSSSWGQIKYTGPKLSTYEEDILLAVLAILDQARDQKITEIEGRTTYTYQGPLLPIFRLMGYKANPSKGDYKRMIEALELMTVAGVKLIIYSRSTKGKRRTKMTDMTNMLSRAKWDEDKKELTVVVNPFFYENYITGTVTLLDVLWRTKLKSPIAKSLHRFMQSHRGSSWKGHFMTLSATLNLEETLPAYKKKERIKLAIRELIKEGFLSKGSGVLKKSPDVVVLIRTSEATKRKQVTSKGQE
jgi:hypothetical protein